MFTTWVYTATTVVVTCPTALSGAIITPAERRNVLNGGSRGVYDGHGRAVKGCNATTVEVIETQWRLYGRIKWKRRNLNLLYTKLHINILFCNQSMSISTCVICVIIIIFVYMWKKWPLKVSRESRVMNRQWYLTIIAFG